jgi:methionyl-tRNA formyltransferase
MRIEFLTQDDPLYVQPFFEEFFRSYFDQFEILAVNCCPTMGKRSRFQLLREILSLYGLVGFARLACRLVTARLLGFLPRARQASRFYTLSQLCKSFQVPYQRIENPNSSLFLNKVRNRQPDVIVSVACPYIIKPQLLAVPHLGCINVHHAPLPRYKGMMPTFWQMFHGEKEVGLTVHVMTPKVDEGAALLQESLSIEPGESLDHLIRRAKKHGAHCVANTLRKIDSRCSSPIPLDHSHETYFTFPTHTEIQEFRRRGLRAI